MKGSIWRVAMEGWRFFRYLVVGMAWGIPFAFTAMIENADRFPLHPRLAGILGPWNFVLVLGAPIMTLLGIRLVAIQMPKSPTLDGRSAIGAIGAVVIVTVVCILSFNYRLAFIIGLPALVIAGVFPTLFALIKRGWVIVAIFVVAWAAFTYLVWEAAQWRPGMADWSTPSPGILLLVGIMYVTVASFGGSVAAFREYQ